jgi:hypothetical protein
LDFTPQPEPPGVSDMAEQGGPSFGQGELDFTPQPEPPGGIGKVSGVEPSPFLPKGVVMALGGTVIALGLAGGAWFLFGPPAAPPVNDPPPNASLCGNGLMDPGEECEPSGNDPSFVCDEGYTCTNSCQCAQRASIELCGNSVVEAGEQCDPPGSEEGCDEGMSCSEDCLCATFLKKPVCGDNVIDQGEQCDGNTCGNNMSCSTDCTCSDCPTDADSPPCVGPQTVGLSCTMSNGAYGICSGSSAAVGWWKPGCDCLPPCPQDSECAGMWDGYPCEKDGVPGDCLGCKCVDSCTTLAFYCEEHPDDCPTEGTCLTDADCAPGGICTEGCSCMPGTCPANSDGCQSNADCPSGLTCDIANCTCFTFCGDGVVGSGEDCDGSDLSLCLAGQVCENCQCVTYVQADTCGNGIVEPPGEQCDGLDSNSLCGPEHTCVDCQCVILQAEPAPQPVPEAPLEEIPGADGSLCGDGICQEGESGVWCGDCPSEEGDGGGDDGGGGDDDDDDDGGRKGDDDDDDGGGRTAPVCGNGKVESGESCDDGGNNGKCGFCNLSCSAVQIC